ncbi:MAG TPA: transporter [Steroidobacteraceae bacterium]|nr:transporter [Steroidobacteraceae bacterium]
MRGPSGTWRNRRGGAAGRTRRLVAARATVAWLPLVGTLAHADGPAFDRPGIAFSSTTMPAHSVTWEQGLLDFQRDQSGGVTQDAYVVDARLRYGLADRWEVQLAAPLYDEIDTHGSGQGLTTAGVGDLSLAVKLALTPRDDRFTMSMLGVVSFPTGNEDIGAGAEQYSLGATLGWTLSDSQSLAFYTNVDLLAGDATWTFAPSWNFDLGETVGGYVEAGYQPAAHGDPANALAGAGLMWLVKPTVQLDAYFLKGLTSESTDLAAGCGVSIFFP